ncbi:lipid II flippase MurJ [Gynuella sp.]|uniref:lipid II flippase MurJ n=1 Tax=Gynuella sp. TaxID=2969146 RepID=UPI003D0C7005
MFKAFMYLFTGNFLSKLLGLVREFLLAWAFGVTSTAAALRIAQAGVFIPINFLTQDLLSAGCLPVFNKYRKVSDQLALSYFISLFFFVMLIGVFLVITIYPIAEIWVRLLASGFSNETMLISVRLLKVFIVSIPFIIGTSALGYLAMAFGSYLIQSVRPSFINLGIISGVLISYIEKDIYYLAITFTISQVCLFCLCVLYIFSRNWFLIRFPTYKQLLVFAARLWKTMKPLVLLPIFLQGYIIIERNVASQFNESTVAALDIARFVSDTSMALIAVPLGFLVLANISSSDKTRSEYILDKLHMVILFLLLPFSSLIVVKADFLVSLLFEYGVFDANGTYLTSSILQIYGVSIFIHALNYQLLKLNNAFRQNRAFSFSTSLGLFFGAIFLLGVNTSIGLSVFGWAYLINGVTVYFLLIYQFKYFFVGIVVFIFSLAILYLSSVLSGFLPSQTLLNNLVSSFAVLLFSSVFSGLLLFLGRYRSIFLSFYKTQVHGKWK